MPAIAIGTKFQVVVQGGKKTPSRAHIITKACGLKQLVKSVGRKNYSAIAKHVTSNDRIMKCILQIVKKRVQKEFTVMCAKKTGSVLRDKSKEAYKNFS